MAAVWPSTLPLVPLVSGYDESAPNTLLRSSMDQGPSRVRRKCSSKPWTFTAPFPPLTKTQAAALETFIEDTLDGGALRFTFTHPRKGTEIECRVVPQSDSALYSISPAGSGAWWSVSLNLEVLP